MPYSNFIRRRNGQITAVISFFLLCFIGLAPAVKAQVPYSFTFQPPTSGTEIFANLVILATNIGNTYTATGIQSGTFDGATIQSIAGTWQWSGIDGDGATFGTGTLASPRLDFTTATPVGNAGPTSSFRLVSASGSGFDWRVYADVGLLFNESRCQASSGCPNPGVSVSAVPGPLAGAGMLSWLAVTVMGLVWRRQWLLAKARTWLAAVRQRHAQAA